MFRKLCSSSSLCVVVAKKANSKGNKKNKENLCMENFTAPSGEKHVEMHQKRNTEGHEEGWEEGVRGEGGEQRMGWGQEVTTVFPLIHW